MISPQTLGSTALWTAAVRALESRREGHLFEDPWAAALAGGVGAAWIAQRSPDSVIPMIIRTRFFDDFLQRVTRENEIRQVVIMAAGMDTRAFRLNWPEHTRLFELDQPAVLHEKEQTLRSAGAQPTCERRVVAVDLTQPWKEALLESGFAAQLPAVWLLEGFLFYLPCQNGAQILDEVASLAAPGSWMGFDTINELVLTSPFTKAWVEMQASQGAPWVGTLDDPEGFLSARGWKAMLTQAGASDANYGHWILPVIPVKMPNMPHNWYVTARKE